MKLNRLEKKMKQSGISKNELADFLRLSRAGLYLKLTGQRSFKFEEVEMMKRILGLSYEELEDILLH